MEDNVNSDSMLTNVRGIENTSKTMTLLDLEILQTRKYIIYVLYLYTVFASFHFGFAEAKQTI